MVRILKQDRNEHGQAIEAESFDGARATLMNWTHAVASGQVDEIVKLYATDAILVPTLSNEIVVSEYDRRRYFEFLLSRGCASCELDQEEFRIDRLRATVAIGGIYTFSFRKTTGEEQVPARFLFTFEELNSRWLITGHHSSRCV